MLLGGALAGCGSDTPSGLRVVCSRGTSVEPVARVEVRAQPGSAQAPAQAVLIYQDPLNKSQTANLRVDPGDNCVVTLANKV